MQKTLLDLLRVPIPVDKNVKDLSNDPAVLALAKEAEQFMRDHPYEPKAKSLKPKTKKGNQSNG